ncbi:hypothetical protein N7486_007208 [Penicillium sp. IBT 16267x]|nr:hypothetical protein N7486_007208 [Penicillium sp. IBT 16267x]
MMEDPSWRIPIISPLIDAISSMKRARDFMLRCEMIQESLRNTLSPILMRSQFSSQSEMEPDLPSDEYMKTGFLKAFEYIKNVSREHSEIEISGAHILIPDFFDAHVRGLVIDAALEAGVHAIGIQSPQEMIRFHNVILDDEVTGLFQLDSPSEQKQNVIIVDYGLRYLHLHTQSSRCRMKRVLDVMSCSRVPWLLYHRVISLDGPLSREVEKGASRSDLHVAL